MNDTAILLITCPDRKGLVARVSTLLYQGGANILHADQHQDHEAGLFFMRVEWALDGFDVEAFRAEFAAVAEELHMTWRFELSTARPRVAIFVSRSEHCLLDLLWRWRRGELHMDIAAVVSNHPDLEAEVAAFGVPYHHIPVTSDTKAEAEQRQLDLLAGKVDLVALARYMQILSGEFLARIGAPVINIHHSFLPAFAGAEPYLRAHDRGVKIIGATAHYATEDLDEGPIIEQDVNRVTHAHTVAELTQLGADIERTVLQRAVTWHCEDRVLVNGSGTVVL